MLDRVHISWEFSMQWMCLYTCVCPLHLESKVQTAEGYKRPWTHRCLLQTEPSNQIILIIVWLTTLVPVFGQNNNSRLYTVWLPSTARRYPRCHLLMTVWDIYPCSLEIRTADRKNALQFAFYTWRIDWSKQLNVHRCCRCNWLDPASRLMSCAEVRCDGVLLLDGVISIWAAWSGTTDI